MVVYLASWKVQVSNLIKIMKNDIIMLIEEKYVDRFLNSGWVIYNGDKEPSMMYEGDE